MRLTVLGSSPSWPNPGEACSGYLVEAGGGAILLDCGNGVLSRLRAGRGDAPPSAIVLSHLHPDHVSDLWSVMFGIVYGPLGAWRGATTLYAPPGGRVVLAEILDGFGMTIGHLERALPVREYRTTAPLAVGESTLRFARTRHSPHSHVMVVEHAGRTLGYTGDTTRTEGLAAAFRGCDLLLCEATMGDAPGGDEHHLSAGEAAAVAADAAVGRLVITHVAAEMRGAALAAARRTRPEAEAAVPGATFEV